MNRLWLVSLIALVALPLTQTPAWACSCIGGMPPCQQLWFGGDDYPPVVFEGTVVSVEEETDPALSDGGPYRYRKVTFRDVQGWIGERSTAVTTGMSDADCGYRFEPGRRYLVHAYGNQANGALRTSICSLTRPVEEAGELLAYLRTLTAPSAGGSVFGRITLDQDRLSVAVPSESSRRPLEGVEVRLSGQMDRFTRSDADGRYRFDALRPGEYEIHTEFPSRPELSGRLHVSLPLRIVNAHACARADVSYAVNGVIAGSLVDAEGKPVPSTIVELRLEKPLQADRPYYAIAPTDVLGRFEFTRLPPGRYVVGVNLERGPDRGRPWAPARSEPPVVELDSGELRTVPPIVTRRLSPIRVRGLVRQVDGSPAIGQRVTAHPATGLGQESFGGSAVTDAQGVFEMELLQGHAYTFSTMLGTARHVSPPFVAGELEPIVVVRTPRD